MTTFQRLRVKEYPQIQARESSEAKYWKSYSISRNEKLLGSPSCIHFNPSDYSNEYLITAGTKVLLMDGMSDKNQRSFTRFEDDAFSAQFRHDGKLIVAGDKTGAVKVFESKSKAMLRQLRQHKDAVRATIWSNDGMHMISGSDDKSIRCWDLALQETIWKASQEDGDTYGHSDYVRTLCRNPSMDNVYVSGSYDHSVKLWDIRQEKPIQTLQHDHPVESTIITNSGTMLITSAANEIKIWDLISGGRTIHSFNHHSKNITCLSLESSGTRLLSGGLDGLLKIYNLETMQVAHSMKLGTPILSCALSPDVLSRKLIVGFVDGGYQARTRSNQKTSSASFPFVATGASGIDVKSSSSRHYKGAGNAVETTADRMIESERLARLRPYEILLKDFNYQKALDAALQTHNPLTVLMVLEELCRRSGLTIALQGRDERTLEPLLSFAARYVAHPRYASLVLDVAHRIIDLYSGVLGHSDAIDELFVKLQRQVRAEMQLQQQMRHVIGTLDCIISASQPA